MTKSGSKQAIVVGTNIKFRRMGARLSQQELGEMVGTTGSTISCYERGQITQLNLDLLDEIANVFEVPLSDLLTSKGFDRIQMKDKRPKVTTPQVVETTQVLQKYEYTIEIDGSKYRVISTRDITTQPPSRFSARYYDAQGQPVLDSAITSMLHKQVMDRVRQSNGGPRP